MKIVKGGLFQSLSAKAKPAPSPAPAPLKVLSSIQQNKDVSIKLMIHEAVAGVEPPRPQATLHASDLMRPEGEFCPREKALLMMGAAKKKGTFIGTALRMTYTHGRHLEQDIRNEYLRKNVVGYWLCGVCGHKSEFGRVPKVKCKCGYGHQWNYDEVRFTSEVSGISCGIDALVDVGEPKFRVVEIKTMAIDMFKKLQAPLAEHKFRTALYMQLISESAAPFATRVNTQKAHILYAAKSFGIKDGEMKEAGVKDSAFSPFKEFVLERDDAIVDTPVRKSIALKRWRDDPSVGLPCGVCTNGLSKRAQSCSAVSACWGGSYPNVLTWTENGEVRHKGKVVVA